MKNESLLLNMTKMEKEEIRRASELTNRSMTDVIMHAWRHNSVGLNEVEILQKLLKNEIESVQTMTNLFKQMIEKSSIREIETIKESVGKSIVLLDEYFTEIHLKIGEMIEHFDEESQKKYAETIRIGEVYLQKQATENRQLQQEMMGLQSKEFKIAVVDPITQSITVQSALVKRLNNISSKLLVEQKHTAANWIQTDIKHNVVIFMTLLCLTGTFSLTNGFAPAESTSFKLFYICVLALFTVTYVVKESQKTFVPVFTILKQKFSHS